MLYFWAVCKMPLVTFEPDIALGNHAFGTRPSSKQQMIWRVRWFPALTPLTQWEDKIVSTIYYNRYYQVLQWEKTESEVSLLWKAPSLYHPLGNIGPSKKHLTKFSSGASLLNFKDAVKSNKYLLLRSGLKSNIFQVCWCI